MRRSELAGVERRMFDLDTAVGISDQHQPGIAAQHTRPQHRRRDQPFHQPIHAGDDLVISRTR